MRRSVGGERDDGLGTGDPSRRSSVQAYLDDNVLKPPIGGAFTTPLERLTDHPFVGVHGGLSPGCLQLQVYDESAGQNLQELDVATLDPAWISSVKEVACARRALDGYRSWLDAPGIASGNGNH